MTDDVEAARAAAWQDLHANRLLAEALGIERKVYDPDGRCDFAGCPSGSGEGMLIPIDIGRRGSLSKAEARRAAAVWRQVTARYPKAAFMICLLGYDQDPREIWQFNDARRYVRWFARYAGLDDVLVAERWLGASSAIGRVLSWAPGAGVGFLAACGVFGEGPRQEALRGFKPVSQQ